MMILTKLVLIRQGWCHTLMTYEGRVSVITLPVISRHICVLWKFTIEIILITDIKGDH